MKLPLSLIYALLAASSLFAEEKKSDAAEPATVPAVVWLEEIDRGEYAGSWEHAAEYFRQAVAKEDWVTQLKGVREPLGETVIRKVRDATAHDSLPGAPDGNYYVLTFDTEFKNKKVAIETVTMLLGEDGLWRTIGYYIK